MTVESRVLKGRYAFASARSSRCSFASLADENRSTLQVDVEHALRRIVALLPAQSNTHLRPGKAPNTARVFSSLHAMWEFKNTSNCEKKNSSDSGRESPFAASEERCHCVGDRSMTTLRCEAVSISKVLNLG